MKKVVVGDILVQDNQERKFGADPQYAIIWVTDDGVKVPIALTKEELVNAGTRAAENIEDIPDLGSEAAINEFDSE